MDFRAQKTDFEEIDRRHAELARQRAAGEISPAEFEARGRDLMVLDEDGRWWFKDPSSGTWSYHNGTNWAPGTPPGYTGAGPQSAQRPSGYPDDSAGPPPYPTTREASAPRAAPPGGSATAHAVRAGGRRGVWRWLLGLVVTVAIIALVGVAGVALVFYISDLGSEPGRQQSADSPPDAASSGEGGASGEAAEEGSASADAGAGASAGASAGAFDAAFVHTSTGESVSANSTYLDHPLLNGNPDAVVYVTQNWNPSGSGGTYNDHPVGVWYDGGRERWAVFNQDRADMPRDASFNVAVLEEAPEE